MSYYAAPRRMRSMAKEAFCYARAGGIFVQKEIDGVATTEEDTVETVDVKEEEIYELDEDYLYEENQHSETVEEVDHLQVENGFEENYQEPEIVDDDDENVFLCDFCCYTFDCQEELVRHMITVHPEPV